MGLIMAPQVYIQYEIRNDVVGLKKEASDNVKTTHVKNFENEVQSQEGIQENTDTRNTGHLNKTQNIDSILRTI